MRTQRLEISEWPGRAGVVTAFTLVELLAVLGILAVLLGFLLPVIGRVRASADRTACAAALTEVGRAFVMYASDYGQTYPVTIEHFAPPGSPQGSFRSLRRHWFDFLSPYLGEATNVDGREEWGWTKLQRGKHPIRGCPRWDVVSDQDGPGYAMNPYPSNTPGEWGLRGVPGRRLSWAVIGVDAMLDGEWPKAARYSMSSQKALVAENLGLLMNVGAWPWWLPPEGPMPVAPDPMFSTIDFRRHGTHWVGATRAETPALNVLFADGHVALASAREAQQAVNFNVH